MWLRNEEPPPRSDPWAFLTQFPPLSKAYSSHLEMLDETEECQLLHDGGPLTILIVGTALG